MLTKNKIKLIKSLEEKKYRKVENAFLAEGHKVVEECLSHFHCRMLIGTKEWFDSYRSQIKADEIIEASPKEIERASLLKSPQNVLAVFSRRIISLPEDEIFQNSLSLALDKVQDPGNMGTIIRIADWFGIEHIFCTDGTADIYNPKVVQASMGAIARIQVHYTDLNELFCDKKNVPVYGTFLDGQNIDKTSLTRNGIILMGNEGNGISAELEKTVTHKLYIPSYPPERTTSESLNVAVATGIVCAAFRNR